MAIVEELIPSLEKELLAVQGVSVEVRAATSTALVHPLAGVGGAARGARLVGAVFGQNGWRAIIRRGLRWRLIERGIAHRTFACPPPAGRASRSRSGSSPSRHREAMLRIDARPQLLLACLRQDASRSAVSASIWSRSGRSSTVVLQAGPSHATSAFDAIPNWLGGHHRGDRSPARGALRTKANATLGHHRPPRAIPQQLHPRSPRSTSRIAFARPN